MKHNFIEFCVNASLVNNKRFILIIFKMFYSYFIPIYKLFVIKTEFLIVTFCSPQSGNRRNLKKVK